VFLRLLLLSLLFFINLYACKGGYASCVQKVKDSNSITEKSLHLLIVKDRRLVYSKEKPQGKILKYDPFLSLYLVEEKSSFAYPFEINMRLQLGNAMVTAEGSCEGRFTHQQVGLDQFARYSEQLIIPSIITSSCCWLEGVVTSKGIIQKIYLKHFLEKKNVLYGDVGIRVGQDGKRAIVIATDPFIKPNPFQKGDIILKMDTTNIQSAAKLMQKILFSSIGSKHLFVIKRGSQIFSFNLIIQKRYGGGFISDTFLESKGLYFDANLSLSKIDGEFKHYGLLVGDRLIQVNGVLVHTQKELRTYIENFQNYSSLLFERNGFEFFVNIK